MLIKLNFDIKQEGLDASILWWVRELCERRVCGQIRHEISSQIYHQIANLAIDKIHLQVEYQLHRDIRSAD